MSWLIGHVEKKIKSILIHEYQHNSTRVNMNQHESARIKTSPTRINTSQHESDTNQHEPNTNQHEPNTNQYESSTRQRKSSTKVRYESNSNLRNYNKLQKYLTQSFYLRLFFSGTMSALYLTAKVSSQMLYWTCLLFTLVWFLHWIVVTKRFLMPF